MIFNGDGSLTGGSPVEAIRQTMGDCWPTFCRERKEVGTTAFLGGKMILTSAREGAAESTWKTE